jgi:hypothetical protein
MSQTPIDDDAEVAGVALAVEGRDGIEETIAVPIRPPADADAVMDLIAGLDEVMADHDPENQDAVMAALILAMGNALRQAPDWPMKARLESFGRFVAGVVEDAIDQLDD